MYKVRFHLAKGANYLKWQVRQGRTVVYVDPSKDSLEMVKCKLVNKVNKAKKVHAAGVKDVAGWVECERIMINNENPADNLEKLFYNPIKDIRWRRESDCGEFAWDDYEFDTLITNGKQVYVLEERSSG
jgi:hypothetical protein